MFVVLHIMYAENIQELWDSPDYDYRRWRRKLLNYAEHYPFQEQSQGAPSIICIIQPKIYIQLT